MKKVILALTALVMMSSNGLAEEMKAMTGKKMPTRFQAVSMDKAEILQEGDAKMYCPRCGMTLPMFYKTNHAAHVDGKSEQYCSIHCLAETMEKDGKVTDLKVVDNTTLKFIDATTASYVFGSSKAGTMSMTSKYAFANKADAESFAKEFGGKVMNFEDTLASVKSTLAKEQAMVQKKQAMMAQKGQMMYKKMCKTIDTKFNSIAEAKSYLKAQKPCGEIKGKQLQAIGIFLNSRNN
ncbi:nitrous oxide reductase accessory protein NosL [Sulfurovum sp.]|uniref:nitrous oxide reductase accessory protein NosL n=1 Tax=Sulfurovum sp. TaxID=1969726 RepID=UPI002867F659|nr:nitrous oxide reductase accessory protein NosL [Sulfurovum sp.]